MRLSLLKKSPLVMCMMLLAFDSATATTVQLTMADQIRVESLSLECSQPGEECPRVPVENIDDVVYLESGDEFQLSFDGEIKIADEAGLLVTYLKQNTPNDLEGNNEINESRFFPMSKVDLSPDSEFYMCDKGREYTVADDTDFTAIGLDPSLTSEDIFQNFSPTSFVCKCFWAPRALFNELGIDKIGKGGTLPPEETPEVPGPIDDIIEDSFGTTPIYQPDGETQTMTELFPHSPHFPDGPDWRPPTRRPPEFDMPQPSPVSTFGACGFLPFVCVIDYFRGE